MENKRWDETTIVIADKLDNDLHSLGKVIFPKNVIKDQKLVKDGYPLSTGKVSSELQNEWNWLKQQTSISWKNLAFFQEFQIWFLTLPFARGMLSGSVKL